MPDCAEGLLAEVAHAIRGVFVETTGYYHAVPGDDAGVPELPAVVDQLVFDLVSPLFVAPVAGVFFL